MKEILDIAEIAIRPAVILFMVGNLMAIGLEIDARAALAPLRDRRFLLVVMVVDWLFAPALAIVIVRALPMAEPYAVGLLLMSLAPAAPFLPMMVRRAGGDLSYTAAFMLVAALGTVLMMPLGVPVIVPGLSIEAWAVARPLLILLVLPMGVGMALRAVHRPAAEKVLTVAVTCLPSACRRRDAASSVSAPARAIWVLLLPRCSWPIPIRARRSWWRLAYP
ncbi:MAG: bile acid:sodium symporter [Reyranella sp.]|nr:bile acid:sodium symporter [Reyranella sp.]